MSAEVDRIEQGVTKLKSVAAGVSKLLTDLTALIRANVNDKVKLSALADEFDARNAEIAQAVIDNTPADPAPPPSP